MIRSRGALEWLGVCYGVDLQDGKPVIIRAERSRGRVNYLQVSWNDAAFQEAINSGKAVSVGCLAASESIACWLETPFSSFHKAGKVLPTLLDVQLPFALDECVYSFMEGVQKRVAGGGPAGKGEESASTSTRALAVAARIRDVEKKVGLLKTLGVDPVVLDQEGVALWTQSLVEVPVDSEDALRVVIYLGKERSAMVVGRGDEFIGSHGIKNDAAQISRLLKAKFASHQIKADIQWIWAGPGVLDTILFDSLKDALVREWPGRVVVLDKPETLLARAVATRALLGGPLRCNLLNGSLVHPFIARRMEYDALKMAMLFVISGLLLCGTNLAWSGLVGSREAAIESNVSRLADRLAGYHVTARGEMRKKQVLEKVDQRKEVLRPFYAVYEASLVDVVGSIANFGKKNDLRYELMSISHDKINVSGVALDGRKCDALVGFLKQKGYQVKIERKELQPEERVSFSIVPVTGGVHE